MSAVEDRTQDLAGDPAGLEALIKEARARARRRRAAAAVTVLVAVACAGVALAMIGSSTKAPTGRPARHLASVLPIGGVVSLATAGPLAVAADGALYVADTARHRVLVRLGDGRFRVIAGDGHDGFSGDGGPATGAELSTITDIAVSPRGDLYIADGGRVRVVDHSGIIRTVAGNGRPLPTVNRQLAATIVAGTPAVSAALGTPRSVSDKAPMIAFSPRGQLYISTGLQVLRLTSRGTLFPIRAVVTGGPAVLRGALRDYGPLAIDDHGNIDVSGFNGWSIWQITPSGAAHEIGAGSGARESGGGYSVLERAPNGTVYGENGSELIAISGRELTRAHRFGGSFWLTNFAFGPRGAIYADEIPGNTGFEPRQQLIQVRRGHAALLWEQRAG